MNKKSDDIKSNELKKIAEESRNFKEVYKEYTDLLERVSNNKANNILVDYELEKRELDEFISRLTQISKNLEACKHSIFAGSNRKYVAINLRKMDTYGVIFWGDGRTLDFQERSYSGYTTDIEKAELYSVEEFSKHNGEYIASTVEEALIKFPNKGGVLIKLEDAKKYKGLKAFDVIM